MTLFALALGLICINACTDPLAIDTNLLNEDQVNIQFKNDFDIVATTIREDSIQTYQFNSKLGQYPLGNYNDPIFGRTSSNIYAQLRVLDENPIFLQPGSILDSVVLDLKYATPGAYGDSIAVYGFTVHQLSEDMTGDTTYYSTQSFESEAQVLGNFEGTPQPADSTTIFVYPSSLDIDTVTTIRSPVLRTHLDYQFGDGLLKLSGENFADNETLLEIFKGLHIKPTTENNGMLAFDLQSEFSRLTLYYKINDKLKEFSFYFTNLSAATAHYDIDYTNSFIEPFIDDPVLGDSLVFLQGMSGTNVKLEFPDLMDLQNVIVNKAELEFYNVLTDQDILGGYEPMRQFIVVEKGDEENFILLEDLSDTNLDIFGGRAEEVSNRFFKYTINISGHLQRMIDGSKGNTLYLRAFPKSSDFSRVVLGGTKHSTNPIKLNLTYTQL